MGWEEETVSLNIPRNANIIVIMEMNILEAAEEAGNAGTFIPSFAKIHSRWKHVWIEVAHSNTFWTHEGVVDQDIEMKIEERAKDQILDIMKTENLEEKHIHLIENLEEKHVNQRVEEKHVNQREKPEEKDSSQIHGNMTVKQITAVKATNLVKMIF